MRSVLRNAGALLGLVAAVLLVVGGIGAFGWGGVLAAIDPNPTQFGVGDGGIAAYVMVMGGMGLATLGGKCWTVCHGLLWPRRDAGGDALLLVAVLFYGALAAGGLLIAFQILRAVLS